MNEFEKIVGYSDIKSELQQIADILKGNEAYTKLGVKLPRGLLLHGEPGLGKTLMATCLIKASGRNVFTCRKDLPNGEFIKAIRKTFMDAKAAAPSIVFLDDMDKFANEDEKHRDAEEYVTVQSCIDEVKDCDVFVLATANSIDSLPDSLLRAGRFDRVIEVEVPGGNDAKAIIAHYMQDKAFSSEVSPELVARLMSGSSCAELETVLNEAGINAGFDKSELITERHFLKAFMKLQHDVSIPSTVLVSADEESRRRIACHEAGHALVHEILDPGSVTLIAVYPDGGSYGGFVTAEAQRRVESMDNAEIPVLTSLGGKAATECVFGECDTGASQDIENAFRTVEKLIRDNALAGFKLIAPLGRSSLLYHEQEVAITTHLERYYQAAKKIIWENRTLLHRLIDALMTCNTLTTGDIQRIKDELKQAG